MVRIHPDPPPMRQRGAIAQLGERLLCKQEVTGSIPVGSTSITRKQQPIARARLLGASSHLETRSADRLLFNNLE